MAKITLSQLPAALGYLGQDGVDKTLRACVREHYGSSCEDGNILPLEYSRQAKEMALFDFKLDTGMDAYDCPSIRTGALNLKANALASDGAVVLIHTPYKAGDEFNSATELPKLMCKAQYLMNAYSKDKCHVYQWSDNNQRLDTVKYNQDYIDKTSLQLESFRTQLDDGISKPDAHLADWFSSRKANMAAEAYKKASYELSSILKRIENIESTLFEETKGKVVCVKGLLVDSTGENIKVIK